MFINVKAITRWSAPFGSTAPYRRLVDVSVDVLAPVTERP
jgi:hypothetical protein